MSRRQLIDIIADLIDCISGPLPPSLMNVLMATGAGPVKQANGSRIDALSDVISATETEVEELVERARSFQIPDYSAIIAAHSNHFSSAAKSGFLENGQQRRHFYTPPRYLTPIPEDKTHCDDDEDECDDMSTTAPKLPSSPPPLTPLSDISPRKLSRDEHSYSPIVNTHSPSPMLSSALFEVNRGYDTVAGDMLEVASLAESVPNETYISELSRIELFLNDRLSDNALARFFPSLYIAELTSAPDSSGFKESIPILIHGTAGYSEDECEVFLRASCIRTGLTGLCRLSQIVPDGSDDSDVHCIQMAQTRLWKLHPL